MRETMPRVFSLQNSFPFTQPSPVQHTLLQKAECSASRLTGIVTMGLVCFAHLSAFCD